MRVKDVMTRNVVPCFPDDTSEQLGRKMQHYQVPGWPIVNHEQRLVGMVTSAD
jgi:CBS domain-containing protein